MTWRRRRSPQKSQSSQSSSKSFFLNGFLNSICSAFSASSAVNVGFLAVGCALALSFGASHVETGVQAQTSTDQPYRAVLDQYCVTCHNDRLRTAGITLEASAIADPAKSQELLEKVVRKLRSRTMPPDNSPRPDAATYDHAAERLEAVLDAVASRAPNPG